MKPVPLEDAQLSLLALIEANQSESIVNLLKTLLDQALTHQRAEKLLRLFKHLSEPLLHRPQLQYLYVQTLCRAREPEAILEFLSCILTDPTLEVYRAWALVRTKDYPAALNLIESLPLDTPDAGLCLRTKGEALYRLGNPDWKATLEQALTHLSGVSLGRALVDYAGFLHDCGQRPAARVRWAEALAYLQGDPYYLAWAHNSLGYALLNEQPAQAERHLLEAVQLSRKEVARGFRCRALAGVGAVRRSLGELGRAHSSYQQAVKAPGDKEDHQQALWGYGHTLRLMGQAFEAYGKLTEAYNLNPKESWIQADIAAACLMLDNPKEAEESLAKVAKWGERSSLVRRFVEAELLRRRQGAKAAKNHLRELKVGNLWVREELHCFPQLRPYLPQAEAVGQPYRVEVNPYGLLEVWVNGRTIPLHPTGKPAEVLVFLLLNGQAVSRERLIDKLCKEEVKNKRKALWEHIHTLRQTLGWPQSVQSKGGLYRLDPAAQWICLEEPQPLGSKEFMQGYYSDWVLEHRASAYVV